MSLQLQEALVSEKICDDLKNGVSLSRSFRCSSNSSMSFVLKHIEQKQPLNTPTHVQHQKLSRSVDKKKPSHIFTRVDSLLIAMRRCQLFIYDDVSYIFIYYIKDKNSICSPIYVKIS